MLSTLSQFSDCILSFKILLQENRGGLSKTKISVELIDGSFIFLREMIILNVLSDYAYHWQRADGKLIIRWDNSSHYPSILTHPHHKHIDNESTVQSSYEQNLFQVLTVIKNHLLENGLF